MPQVAFAALPDSARIWVFAADRELTSDEASGLLDTTDQFLSQWAAHGVPLTCGRDFRYGRFLLVGVDEAAAGVSGCSIDALLRNLKELERRLALSLLDHGPVLYRTAASIARVTRAEFAALAQQGEVDLSTTVFNNTVATVGDVRGGRWETAAAESWHGQAFWS